MMIGLIYSGIAHAVPYIYTFKGNVIYGHNSYHNTLFEDSGIHTGMEVEFQWLVDVDRPGEYILNPGGGIISPIIGYCDIEDYFYTSLLNETVFGYDTSYTQFWGGYYSQHYLDPNVDVKIDLKKGPIHLMAPRISYLAEFIPFLSK
jgi:hypothetical protein